MADPPDPHRRYEFRCPVHGFIEVDHWERCVINPPAFQRLRRIRQLAWTEYVYPGNVHTRFEHSLGVMHAATRVYDADFARVELMSTAITTPLIKKLNCQLPLNDSIARIAERIENLIPANASSIRRQEITSTLDLLLGAVHALFLASECGFQERRRTPIEIKAVKKRAAQLKVCEVRTDGVWMAGFHLNSALARLAGTYHRALKMFVEPRNEEDD